MPRTCLADRSVVAISGPEARGFLDGIVTCDMGAVAPGRARFGALLTPQGKIAADFIATEPPDRPDGTFLLDVSTACTDELVKRLKMYRLRAKIAIDDLSAEYGVMAGWDGEPIPPAAIAGAPDPRLTELGWRAIVPAPEAGSRDADPAAYHARRIALGVPEGGRDYAFGDAFPHEALMDQLAGVAFDKGCYVGQEVVSRMQHRGTARTRIAGLSYPEGEPAPAGSEVVAGGRALGRVGAPAGGRALGLLRLDRVAEAMAAGEPVLAGGVPVRLEKPSWVRFPYPGEPAASAA